MLLHLTCTHITKGDKMEFADFDDDLFVEKQESKKVVDEYSARVCEDGWFLQVAPSQIVSSEDELGVLKFSAEYQFMNKKYSASGEKYEEILRILPVNNSTCRRECFEGLSRCYIKNNKTTTAVHYAEKLHLTSRTLDQQTVSFSVLLDAYLAARMHKEALRAAQSIVSLHPDNSQVWTKLGFTYACMHNIVLPNVKKMVCAHLPILTESSDGSKKGTDIGRVGDTSLSLSHTLIGRKGEVQASHHKEDGQTQEKTNKSTEIQEPDKMVWIVSACLQRAYTLLKKTEGTAVGFAVNYSQLCQKKLLDDLQNILDGVSLCKLQTAVLHNDKMVTSLPTDMPEENSEFIDKGSSKIKANDKDVDLSFISGSSFEDKWFKWLQ